eukprot:CAMPEP_0202876466 /NCGR_PEP_ID=MMETSP1391-20130828/29040_1 /ASSEMBLY_ACC=CAM_ASM_000867 /TAXON_ID=1034604 /ORGANISM="Chlamydomonas leiostraca, Strain SAG 11-49" /LENGTH=39 /DNA_ID= /DNA_START= /DNA_END= /DNA_ORIENTATION=
MSGGHMSCRHMRGAHRGYQQQGGSYTQADPDDSKRPGAW